MAKGLIHVYTGEGKGKTTAAFGLAKRAAGHGRKVLILQFLKSRTGNSGEMLSAKRTGITVIKFRDQTTPLFDPAVKLPELKAAISKAVSRTIKEIKSGSYDVAVLDEFNTVLSCGYATMKDAERIIEAKPEGLELIFTGRGAPAKLIDLADYVTEMRMIKHPFKNGVKARKGIEF
ncbi:MAG: cob(I)yrinic acid a,c-diamide adenosyltransferase [Nitrospirota bacterium]|nr:cob(I)yrinic acid a,c-diamide adenosyltransferase [Nitrospirota bacterium]